MSCSTSSCGCSNPKVTIKGNPVTLFGPVPKAGQKAPEFTLRDQTLSPKTLADFAGKVKVIITVPSVDTPVCDIEIRRFNESAAALGADVVILPVSVDMPMAQKRWCGAAGVDKVTTLSDYFDHSFGKAWGVRIVEKGFLARAVFVLGKDNTVKYAEIVADVATEPNYEAALAAAKSAVAGCGCGC